MQSLYFYKNLILLLDVSTTSPSEPSEEGGPRMGPTSLHRKSIMFFLKLVFWGKLILSFGTPARTTSTNKHWPCLLSKLQPSLELLLIQSPVLTVGRGKKKGWRRPAASLLGFLCTFYMAKIDEIIVFLCVCLFIWCMNLPKRSLEKKNL